MRRSEALALVCAVSTLVLASVGCVSGRAESADVAPGMVICGGLVPDDVKRGNASFLQIYRLRTDADGQVVEVAKLRGPALVEGAVDACFRSWRLPRGSTETTVAMRWEHASGWTQLAVSAPGQVTRTITLSPGWPY